MWSTTCCDRSENVSYAVLLLDQAILLRQKAPWLNVRLLQLDAGVAEKITDRPPPKTEHPIEAVRWPLRIAEVTKDRRDKKNIRRVSFQKVINEIISKGYRKVSIFNDVMKEGVRIALQRMGSRR